MSLRRLSRYDDDDDDDNDDGSAEKLLDIAMSGPNSGSIKYSMVEKGNKQPEFPSISGSIL